MHHIPNLCLFLRHGVEVLHLSSQLTSGLKVCLLGSHVSYLSLARPPYPQGQGLAVALEPVMEPALVVQAGLEHTEIHLPLPPGGWDYRREPSLSSKF